MRLFGPARLALEDRLVVDAALDEAFAPLRAQTANIGAARVRAAVRWSPPEPARLRGFPLLARIGELSMVAVISAFVFSASLASLSATGAMPEGSRDAAVTGGWVLNGRNALQRPIDSLATDWRTTAGEIAANAAMVHRASQNDGGQELTAPNQ
jgi:hypothetical protein